MIAGFNEFSAINEAKANTALVLTDINFDNTNKEDCLMGCYIKTLLVANKVKNFVDAGRYYARIVAPLTQQKADDAIDNIATALKSDKNFISHFNVNLEYANEEYYSNPWLPPITGTGYLTIFPVEGGGGWRLQVSNI